MLSNFRKTVLGLTLVVAAAVATTACKKPAPPKPVPTPTPAPTPVPTPVGAGSVEIGINSHLLAGAQIDAAKELGAKTARIDIPWCSIERRGTLGRSFDFSAVDAAVSKARGLGLAVYATVSCTPDFAVRDGQPAGSGVPKLADWQDFVRVMADRYRGQIQTYGIWQQPNLAAFFSGTARDYIEVLLRPAALIIRERASGALVAGPDLAFSHESSIPVQTFLDELATSGAISVLDVLTVHVYGEGDFRSNLQGYVDKDGLVQMLYKSGLYGRKDLWITEFGSDDARVGEPGQATRLVDMIRTMAGIDWIKKAFIYEIADGGSPTSRYGLLRANGSRKPSFDAVKSLLAEVAASAARRK